MDTLTDPVDLLVHFCPVVVTLLTSTGNSEGNSARMPRTNASNLTQTLVCLPGKFLGVPTGGNTCTENVVIARNKTVMCVSASGLSLAMSWDIKNIWL